MYESSNHYWRVGGDDTRLYSSAAAAYVAAGHPAYVGWLEEGGVPTSIVNEAELRGVLAAQYPAGWPTLKVSSDIAALGAYGNDESLIRGIEDLTELALAAGWPVPSALLAKVNARRALRGLPPPC